MFAECGGRFLTLRQLKVFTNLNRLCLKIRYKYLYPQFMIFLYHINFLLGHQPRYLWENEWRKTT